jgi:hypothetical protein
VTELQHPNPVVTETTGPSGTTFTTIAVAGRKLYLNATQRESLIEQLSGAPIGGRHDFKVT